MGGRRRKTAEYTWRGPSDQSLHFRKIFDLDRPGGLPGVAARITFNQHGIAEFVAPVTGAPQGVIRAAQR
jgi:hypothetical protein